MARHTLTDRQVRNFKPKEKPYRKFDGDGLALLISPTGSRSWQLRYRLGGKEQTASLGKLESVSLAEARIAAEAARKLAAEGHHLTAVKHTAKVQRRVEAANTFGAFAASWSLREARLQKWSPDYLVEVEASLRNHLSDLNRLPMTKITAVIVAPLLIATEESAPHMVEKVRRRLRAIFDDAVEQGILTGNPLPAMRRRRKIERKHYPAVTDLTELGAILRAARASDPLQGDPARAPPARVHLAARVRSRLVDVGRVRPRCARARRQAFAALLALGVLDGRTRGRQGWRQHRVATRSCRRGQGCGRVRSRQTPRVTARAGDVVRAHAHRSTRRRCGREDWPAEGMKPKLKIVSPGPILSDGVQR